MDAEPVNMMMTAQSDEEIIEKKKKRIYLYMCSGHSLIAYLIRFITYSFWHHVAIGIEDEIFEADWDGVVKYKSFDIWQRKRINDHINIIQLDITEEQYIALLKSLDKKLGSPYDYWALLGYLFRTKRLNQPNKYFCSELINTCFREIDFNIIPKRLDWRVTPAQLAIAAYAYSGEN